MTRTQNYALAPRDDGGFLFFASGAQFFPEAGARLAYASRAPATLFLPGLPPALLDGASEVTVEYGGATVFRGTPARWTDRTVRGLTVRDVTCEDAWGALERKVFRQSWKVAGAGGAAVETDSARVALNVDALGRPVILPSQVGDVCSYCGLMMSDGGIPNVALPCDVAENITCADAVRRLLRLFPKVVARAVPYAGGTMAAFSVPDGSSPAWLAEGRVLSRAKRYTAHPVAGVDIATESVDVAVSAADGGTAAMRAYTHQTAGDVGSDDCLHVYMPLAGGSASTSWETLEVSAEDIPDIADAAWWKEKHPRLANAAGATVTVTEAGRSSETYSKITGNDVGALRAFGLGAEVVRFWCRAKVETEDDEEEELYLTMDFATTDASPGGHTRQAGSSYEAGETLPDGLAQAILDQRAGDLEAEDVEIALGTAFPQVGDSLDGLVCQTVEVDCGSRVARLGFGHPGYLSAEDMRSLLNGFRGRGRASNVPKRASADPDGGTAAVAGGVMPLSTTEFSPGTKAKTTIRHADAAAASGKIVLDAGEVGAGDAVAVRDAVFADGTAGKALATKALEVCYV